MCESRCISLAVALVALVGQGLCLAGCGQKGPLTMPAAAQAPAAGAAAAPGAAASAAGLR